MNPKKQRIAMAEACGFENIDLYLPGNASIFSIAELKGTKDGKGETSDAVGRELIPIPFYLNDLNAMHEAEKILTPEQARLYHNILGQMGIVWLWHATAEQKAEAFLKALGLWTP